MKGPQVKAANPAWREDWFWHEAIWPQDIPLPIPSSTFSYTVSWVWKEYWFLVNHQHQLKHQPTQHPFSTHNQPVWNMHHQASRFPYFCAPGHGLKCSKVTRFEVRIWGVFMGNWKKHGQTPPQKPPNKSADLLLRGNMFLKITVVLAMKFAHHTPYWKSNRYDLRWNQYQYKSEFIIHTSQWLPSVPIPRRGSLFKLYGISWLFIASFYNDAWHFLRISL